MLLNIVKMKIKIAHIKPLWFWVQECERCFCFRQSDICRRQLFGNYPTHIFKQFNQLSHFIVPMFPVVVGLIPSVREWATSPLIASSRMRDLRTFSPWLQTSHLFFSSLGISGRWEHVLEFSIDGKNSAVMLYAQLVPCLVSPFFFYHYTNAETWHTLIVCKSNTAGSEN